MASRIAEFLATLREAIGVRRFAVEGIVGVVLGLVDWAARQWDWWPLTTTPHWFVWLLIVAGLLVWWLLTYANGLRTRMRVTRVALSVLRNEGVDLRNRIQGPILDQAVWDGLRKKIDDWNTQVIAELRQLNEADANLFSILDVVEPPRVPPSVGGPRVLPEPWVNDRLRLYSWQDVRVKRLFNMIQPPPGSLG